MFARMDLLHALCLATVAFAVVYAFVNLGPYYHPVEHVWSMQKLPGTPAMGWYARFTWSSLAALATVLVAATVLARPALHARIERHARGASLAFALLAFFALTSTLAYLAYNELTHAAAQLSTHS